MSISAENRHLFFYTAMSRPKNDIIYPHLNNADGDMNAAWYVEYSVRNNTTGKMERKRTYKGFAKLNTYEERMEHAKKLIDQYTKKIESGDISTVQVVEYDDELLFNTATFKFRKRLGPKFSFRVMASRFIAMKRKEVNKDTIQTYKSKLRIFNEFLSIKKLHDKNITSIKNHHVVEFMNKVSDENNLSRTSVNKYQQILYTFFKWAIEKERVYMENPVMNIPRLGLVVDESAPSISRRVRAILKREIKKEDPQLWLNICFQYYCAIRPAELRMMKLKHINYDNEVVTVYNFLAKNHRTETVGIPKQLMRMIESLNLQNYDQSLYLFSHDGRPGVKPLGKNNMRNRFNRIRDSLNLSNEIKLYSWKHAGAMELVESGANVYKIQRHFRHKSLTTTERYWAKRLGGAGKQILEEFPDI